MTTTTLKTPYQHERGALTLHMYADDLPVAAWSELGPIAEAAEAWAQKWLREKPDPHPHSALCAVFFHSGAVVCTCDPDQQGT